MLSQCAILVGAGISLDAPANFPIASNIMNAILEGISPSVEIVNSLKSLKVRTEGNYAELEDIYHLTGDQIRFETLIDVVSKFDKELNILDAICNYTTPNLNHYNLANLAIHGNYILTPNFDDLIERAIINLGYNPITICSEHDFASYKLEAHPTNNSIVPVFKLHGSFFRYKGNGHEKSLAKETLQASLTSILSNNQDLILSTSKYRLLKSIMETTNTLIAAGYSGFDDFDIVPSLKKLRHLI